MTKNKSSFAEAKKEYKRLAPVVFSRSFATVVAVPVKKFDVSTQTQAVESTVKILTVAGKTAIVTIAPKKAIVVDAVTRTDTSAQTIGGKGRSVEPPKQGRPTAQPLPPPR